MSSTYIAHHQLESVIVVVLVVVLVVGLVLALALVLVLVLVLVVIIIIIVVVIIVIIVTDFVLGCNMIFASGLHSVWQHFSAASRFNRCTIGQAAAAAAAKHC